MKTLCDKIKETLHKTVSSEDFFGEPAPALDNQIKSKIQILQKYCNNIMTDRVVKDDSEPEPGGFSYPDAGFEFWIENLIKLVNEEIEMSVSRQIETLFSRCLLGAHNSLLPLSVCLSVCLSKNYFNEEIFVQKTE
jgi:hypothetical protein